MRKNKKMDAAQKRIQNEFRAKICLVVDVPKHGCGTSNDGNTARKFFQDPELTSEITGVNKELIRRFSIILQAMAFNKSINVLRFRGNARLLQSFT